MLVRGLMLKILGKAWGGGGGGKSRFKHRAVALGRSMAVLFIAVD